jgi:hypothetical protein
MVIKRVGPMSLAKIAFVLYAGIGLLVGVVVSLISVAGMGARLADSGAPGFIAPLIGVGAVVLLPICYGLFGSLGALIGAALFNAAAKMTGGVEIEVQS